MPTASDGELVRALIGAWQLVRWTIEYPPSGRVTQPFGADPEGLLVYTADGHMSAVMQRRNRPRCRAPIRMPSAMPRKPQRSRPTCTTQAPGASPTATSFTTCATR